MNFRLYDDVAAMIGIERFPERGRFSPLWFVSTVRNTIAFAAAAIPEFYSERAMAGVLWRFINPVEAPLHATDEFGGKDYLGTTKSIYEGMHLWNWTSIEQRPEVVANLEAQRLLDRIHDNYNVPVERRPSLEQAR